MNTADTRTITLCIRAHMALLGTDAALSLARAVPGLSVADNGDILRMKGNAGDAIPALEKTYAAFAGEASRALMRTFHAHHQLPSLH